jgi:simple sugar transport system substrate-binding protein
MAGPPAFLEGSVNRFPPRPNLDRHPAAEPATPVHRGNLRRPRGLAVSAALALIACLLAACSSQGVVTTPANSAAKGPRITVAMVTHGQSTDPFWGQVKAGAQTAATDFNVKLVYSAPSTTNPQEQASLITQAVAQHPKGLIVTIPDAAVLSAPIKQAVSAGIPVIVMNVGAAVYQNAGGLTFVGQDEPAAGQEAGRQMAAAGVHKALCVIHEEQNTALVDRCAGFAKALAARGGSVKILHVDGTHPDSAAKAIESALKADPSIDGVLTVGIPGFNAAGGALHALNAFGRIKLGTFDVTTTDLNAVSNGQALFIIDQQPFLEGYTAVQITAFEVRYGQHPFGPILTGPSPITKANVAQVEQLYKNTGVSLIGGGYPV